MLIKLGMTSYSFQDELAIGLMSLEDTMAALAAIGGTGYEAILEQVLPKGNFMNLSDSFVSYWNELLAKYSLEATCADIFDDFNLYRNRTLSEKEQLEYIVHYLKVANRLGFKTIRVLCNTPISVLDKALPIAEDLNLKLGLEIHAPLSMKTQWALNWQELLYKKNAKNGGFIPDFGIFGLRPLTLNVARAIRNGANPEICDFIVEEYKKNAKKRAETGEIIASATAEEMLDNGPAGSKELAEKVLKMGGGKEELALVNARLCYDNPLWLVEVLDLIIHVHGKFYDMVEDGKGGYTDPNIDTETVIRVLRDNGYDGYISSEYEGSHLQREPSLDISYDSIEQVRRHHVMIRNVLTEPYKGLLIKYDKERRNKK